MSEKFEKLRFRVAKTGRAKYISHLDVVRCVQRAIRRSGLPVHYTNGFHPHMEAVFATALPLGMESIGEVLEIRFAEPVEPEAARASLQAALPEGMELLQVYQPVHKMGELAYVRYRVTIPNSRNSFSSSGMHSCSSRKFWWKRSQNVECGRWTCYRRLIVRRSR